MIEDEEVNINNLTGRASKVDKWKYNDILNDIARRALYNLATPSFGYWSKRFVKALRVINIKNLPMKDMIDKQDFLYRDTLYYNKIDELKKNNEVWFDLYKRDYYLDKWEEEYYVAIFDFCLELATQAGFTFHLDSIDESVAIRMNM